MVTSSAAVPGKYPRSKRTAGPSAVGDAVYSRRVNRSGFWRCTVSATWHAHPCPGVQWAGDPPGRQASRTRVATPRTEYVCVKRRPGQAQIKLAGLQSVNLLTRHEFMKVQVNIWEDSCYFL